MKKDKAISILILSSTVAIDFILKSNQMQKLNQSLSHINHGFIFGSLQDLPPSLTLVTLTSFGGVLFSLYLLLIVILSSELLNLKIGLGFLCGGILGNVIDRAVHGGTLDFIPLTLLTNTVVFFNPADIFQWVGSIFITFDIFSKDRLIWHPANQRGFGLINPEEQIRVALKFSAISFSTCLILGIFSVSYLTLTMKALNSFNKSTIISFIICYFAITIFFNIMAFIAGIILSQKSAGPLYAFEKYVESLLAGELNDLKLREGDNYKHLENVAHNLKSHFKKNQQ